MHPIIKNSLAVIIGWLLGSAVNMGLIMTGQQVWPIKGIDPNNIEELATVMPTLGAHHFVFPLLAHALGTLVGAIATYLIAANHKMKFALSIGLLFLIGGIMVNWMLPGPTWFTVTDIGLAYLPMAWLGGKLVERFVNPSYNL